MKHFLFVWIPKTGGTSLFSVLKPKFNMALYTEKYATFNNSGNVCFGHADPKLLLKNNIIGAGYWSTAYKFTVVRNPYIRFISLYHDYKRTGRIPPAFTPKQFASLLMSVTCKPGLYNTTDFSMCAPQSDWLTPDIKIFSLETINGLLEQLNIKALPQLNQREPTKPWTDYYDEELTKMVQQLYNEDFAILKY